MKKPYKGQKGADRKIAADETGFHFRSGKGIGPPHFPKVYGKCFKKQKAPG